MAWIGSIASQKRRARVAVGSIAVTLPHATAHRKGQYRKMDQDLAWWAEVVFGGWRDRPGPRYQQLATALLDAVDRRDLRAGTRVPAERSLAASVGVSRG